jgi:hypothetical protein
MIAVESTTDRQELVTPHLRLRFDWLLDRWIHAIDLLRAGAWECVLESVESPPDEVLGGRVVSPAYQQSRLETGQRGTQVLLLGQSGHHHFSAVFSMTELNDSVRVEVDIADRCREPVSSLSATYRLNLPATAIECADASLATWRTIDLGGSLDFGSFGPASDRSRIVLAESGRRMLAQAESAAAPSGRTHRLYYFWRFAPDCSAG